MAYLHTDGTVRTDSGSVAWVDCSTHGAALPAIIQMPGPWGREYPRVYIAARLSREKLARCAACSALVPLRFIKLRRPRKGRTPAECSGACTSGKVSCDCRCLGRCHGA